MTETAGLAQLLASRLQALWGAAAEITGVERLAGGASRESWGVQARMAGGAEHRLILLRDPGRSDRHRDVAVEAAAMAAARAAGVPVPELFDHGKQALGPGRAYLLMERLDGETIPRRLLRARSPNSAAGWPKTASRRSRSGRDPGYRVGPCRRPQIRRASFWFPRHGRKLLRCGNMRLRRLFHGSEEVGHADA
jgi:aminoglycoside phosphotransferase (APT) family kinase protein